mmetsp:Transcript_12999/g.23905  ORF Transcript_12999/g.23905 Transcript_12999/m.23905 type:complete len:480 (-) Transcript_12999:12-1451(-)
MATIRVDDEVLPLCFESPAHEEDAHQGLAVQHILIYGDNLVAGAHGPEDSCAPFGAELARILEPPNAVWVCGLIGMTVGEMTQEVQASRLHDAAGRCGSGLQSLVRLHAQDRRAFDVALILAGAHELQAPFAEPEAIADSILHLHAACHREDLRTIGMSIPPARKFLTAEGQDSQHFRTWKRVNELLREGVEEGTFSRWVATFVDVSDLSQWNETLFDGDGVSLSPAGSKHLAQLAGDSLRVRVSPLCRPVLPDALIGRGGASQSMEGHRVQPSMQPLSTECLAPAAKWRKQRAEWLQVSEDYLQHEPASFDHDGALQARLERRRLEKFGQVGAKKLTVAQREEVKHCLQETQRPFPRLKQRLPLNLVVGYASRLWDAETQAEKGTSALPMWMQRSSWFNSSWMDAMPELNAMCAEPGAPDRITRPKTVQGDRNCAGLQRRYRNGGSETGPACCQEVQPNPARDGSEQSCAFFPFAGWR